MFEYETVCLLNLLSCTFEELHVFKPGSSKSGNSEVYLICLRYKGIQIIEHIWDQLLRPYKSNCKIGSAMFTIDQINAEVISQVINCTNFFMQKQIHTINGNIEHFKKNCAFENVKTKEIRFEVANYYMRRYEVIRIPPEKKILQYHDTNRFSFFSKQIFYKKEWIYEENYKEFDIQIADSVDLSHFLEIKIGKRFDKIFHSNFCCRDYLNNFDSAACIRYFDNKLIDIALDCTADIDGDHTIVSTKNCDKYFKQYEFQKYLFYELKLQLMKNQIIFLKIPFLTCFLVELLYLLMLNFEKAIFHKEGFIVFHTKNVRNLAKVEKCFEQISGVYENISTKDSSDIVQLFPLDYILHSPFFQLIWNYNNAVCQSM